MKTLPVEEKFREENPPDEATEKKLERRLGLMGWSFVLLIVAMIVLALFLIWKNTAKDNMGTQPSAVTATEEPQAADEPTSVAEATHTDKAGATEKPQAADEPAPISAIAPIDKITYAKIDTSSTGGTVHAIGGLGATITLPAGWTPDEATRSVLSENQSEDDSARLVFLASTSDEESLFFVAVSDALPLSVDNENLRTDAFLEKYQAILRDENHGTHITAVQAVDTAAICYAMEEPDRTAYMAMMVYGSNTLFIQQSPLSGGFDESGYAAFQGVVASIDFAAEPPPDASILETFQANLEASGLKGVSIQYVKMSETEGKAYAEIHRLRYGDYDATVYLFRNHADTLTGLVLSLPCGLAYQDEDDLRVFQDLKVIESACALFDPSDRAERAELVLRIYQDILNGMNGAAPTDGILWNGRRYLGKYDANMEAAVLLIDLE